LKGAAGAETARILAIVKVKEAAEHRSEERTMFNFTTKENNRLMMDLEGRGILFQYSTWRGQREDVFEVTQSWASIHALLAKLRNDQQYAAWDKSFLVWMQDQELYLKFRALDTKLEEECNFSAEETTRIMDFLGRAPNLN
jgi:hypothetical protein